MVGADPLDTEVLWHRMYHMTRDYGRKGSVVAAISAIDIALWDIAGKFHEVPVYTLLGGAFRTRVQPYATGFYRIEGQGEAQRLAEEAIRHFDAGFSLMKVKLGYGVDDDIACMQAIGRAIQGKPITLMIDTNHAYGRAEALRLGRALEEYDLRWYEEPVVPEDIRGYAEMRSKLSMPIAGGENEHTLLRFSRVARRRRRRHRPARHRLVRRHHRGAPHRRAGAVARRAGQPARLGLGDRAGGSLQLIAALPVAHHSLFAQEPVLEYDRSSHPFRQQLITRADPAGRRLGRHPCPPRPRRRGRSRDARSLSRVTRCAAAGFAVPRVRSALVAQHPRQEQHEVRART